ncbi:XdhC family protein [Acidocella sp.]|uniref:XdhC family protein n=1 Tax=Acidocella sp. TaxID=50710 RepID=UPI00260F722E|nr:XdhC family protein [Acidocella sp.]
MANNSSPSRYAAPPDALSLAVEWHEAGEVVAIATVTSTWGSSPCPPGSRMVVTKSGRIAGSVSGGCIEGAVIHAAQEVIASGQPVLLAFGVTDEMAWEVGLACGGKVQIFVEPVS